MIAGFSLVNVSFLVILLQFIVPYTSVSHKKILKYLRFSCSGVPRNFFGGGVQQIQLRTEDRENGDLGA